MATSKLLTQVTAAYMEGMDKMYPQGKSAGTTIYVEGIEDQLFWSAIVTHIQGIEHPITVTPYQKEDIQQEGKDRMLQDASSGALPLSKRLFLCVDSDWDNLIDDYHQYSAFLRKNPFVVQTKWYAKENIQCHPTNLCKYYQKITLAQEQEIPDFEFMIKDVSELLAPLFLYTIMCRDSHFHLQIDEDKRYSIERFNEILRQLQFDDNGITDRSKQMVSNTLDKIRPILMQYTKEFENVEQRFTIHNIDKYNYYKFFQGHGFEDFIAIPMVYSFALRYREKYINKIDNSQWSEKKKRDKRNAYYKTTGTKEKEEKRRIAELMQDTTDVDDLEWNSFNLQQMLRLSSQP